MIRLYFLISLFFVIQLNANAIKELSFKGDIDLVIGDFSRDKLLRVCDIHYPPFFKFWQEKPSFNLYQIQICQDSILEYSKSLGFYNADISYEIQNSSATIYINKNNPIFVSSIKIDEDYKKLLLLKENDHFTTSKFTQSKTNIKNFLSQTGYPKGELDAKAYVDLDNYKVDMVFEISKGEPHYFGTYTIQNDAKVESHLIEKQIQFKQGDLYNSLALEETYEGLYNFGIYQYIAVEPDMTTNTNQIPVNIELQQGAYRELGYGFGYDTDRGANVKASYKNDNFYGNLKKFKIGALVNQKGYKIDNNLFIPQIPIKAQIFDDVSVSNDISFEDMDYESYSQQKIDERITLSKDFFGTTNSIGFLSETSKIKSKLAEYKSGSYWLNAPFYQIVLDRRDSSLNPKNGYYVSFYIEKGSEFFASEIDYTKTLTELRYIKSFSDITASFKTTVGTLDRNLPIFKHFFAGGDYSNRGYQYQMVGETDPDGNPYGGLSMIDTTLEVEYYITDDLGVATFYDTTMLSRQTNTWSDKFYDSVGLGARYYTPIGPLRIDFGFPLKKGGFVFHIGIGQVF